MLTTRLLRNFGSFDKLAFKEFCQTKFVFGSSFPPYRPIPGLFDHGPILTSLMNNTIEIWRKMFLFNDRMLEIDTSIISSGEVLRSSGHEERFNDIICTDLVTGDRYRVDHLVTDFLRMKISSGELNENIVKNYTDRLKSLSELEKWSSIINEFGVKSSNGNQLSQPEYFNLMFETSIGPSKKRSKGYLRPETAQGQILNFRRLYEYNRQQLPLCVGSVGKAYRNEISPRGGLVRAREFNMAEIEHFYDPENEYHQAFNQVVNLKLPLYTSDMDVNNQDPLYMTLGEAVDTKIISNTILAYYLGRSFLFFQKLGLNTQMLRFRQQTESERAHYARDCWDAEVFLRSQDAWIECMGCADRGNYDLLCHQKALGEKMSVKKVLDKPVLLENVTFELNKKVAGKILKHLLPHVQKYLNTCSLKQLKEYKRKLMIDKKLVLNFEGKFVELTDDMISFPETLDKSNDVEFLPHIIEPSFGINRILLAVLDHSWSLRDENTTNEQVKRFYLDLPTDLAPCKCLVAPLSNDKELKDRVNEIGDILQHLNLENDLDLSSTSIGKKYARADAVGTPYAITVDFESKTDGKVTLRERNSMSQLRISKSKVGEIVQKLVKNEISWEKL